MSHSAVLVAINPPTYDASPEQIEEAVSREMAPFDENGEWVREGSRWDWWQIGGLYSGRLLGKDVIARSDLAIEPMLAAEAQRYRDCYARAASDANQNAVGLLYGVDPSTTTLEEYLEEKTGDFPWFGAFLKDRVWQEEERLGWFGGTFKTECEIKTGETPNICIYHNETDGAKIVSWNSDPLWRKKFYARFIEKLPPETLLVAVDYHV